MERRDPAATLLLLESKISKIELKESEVISSIEESKQILEQKEEEFELVKSLQEACQIVASCIQKTAHEKITRVVNKCLSTVFDDPYEAEIIFERKRNKTEAQIVFKRDGHILDDPMEESGGGAIDVAAFAFRLACIMLSQPQKKKLLILDEPFKFVSKRYRPRIRQLLNELVEACGLQIIMITHIQRLKTGTIYELQ